MMARVYFLVHNRCLTPFRTMASLVVTDAIAGELTLGTIRTIPATVETENTRS